MNKKELKKRKKLLLELISAKEYRPMKAKEIASLLQLSKGQKKELQEVLDALIEEGKISASKQGRYRKAKERKYQKKNAVVTGTFTGHPRGYGFVSVEDEEKDIFIPVESVGNAFHLDQVEVQITGEESENKRKEGRIVKILSHGLTEIVGTYEKSRHYGFVVPDQSRIQQDIFIPQEKSDDARDGDKVVVKITSYGSKNKSPEGIVTEVLGQASDPGVDVMSVARDMGLPMEFPQKAAGQAARTAQRVQEQDFQGRLDLRHLPCVTIDGEEAKDLDDAITLMRTWDGYQLGVHIADVSNYVQAGSALDREAFRRGTSVYLADRVIPMLPRELSNGICSLNQGEDRLALSCLMKINDKGKVVSHEIAETVICVDRRMTYTAVQKVLDGDEKTKDEYQDFVSMFLCMEELSGILRKRRKKRGAIDFDFPETKVILDEKGHPLEIKAYERNTATDIIEDFMLLANETVAKEYHERNLPFLYRIHGEPDADKIENVLSLARTGQIKAEKKKQKITPGEVQSILTALEDQPLEPMISRLLLRSMQQARYSTADEGHFGLAARHYCHFTSPIRRYPDLQIHRIIKDVIRGRMNPQREAAYRESLDQVAESCSRLERRAEEAERETVKLKKAEYMKAHVGEEFDGVISGVTGWGIYVELPNTVEGLVSVNSMWDDYYIYDENAFCLTGESTGKTYRLGQKVTVVVEDADPATRTVDFRLKREEDR